ncbi:MAG: YceI family protein [Casimicrobiaceae bacterium]
MRKLRLVLLLAAAAVAACVPQEVRPPGAGPVAAAPEDLKREYDGLARSGQPVFEVDPARSIVTIEVRRAGTLANLGHDHVVASHDVRGYIAPREGRADVYIRVADLVVDEAQLREAAGFDTQPSAADIAGTRSNMLARVLHSDEQPFVVASATGVRTDAARRVIRPTLVVNGIQRVQDVDAAIEMTVESMRVTGQTVVSHTDFGIRPFSILGGALQVADALTVRFDILARRR